MYHRYNVTKYIQVTFCRLYCLFWHPLCEDKGLPIYL